MSTAPTRSRIGRRELFRLAEERGHVVICDECERALDKDGWCSVCDRRERAVQPPLVPTGSPLSRLQVRDIADVVREVELAGRTDWLIEGLWPADAYGVMGAEDKAGKTWATLDLGVSVVTGTPWLNHFPCGSPGPVVAFLGEGGERPMLRRIRAIVAERGGDVDDLGDLRLCFAVPRLRPADDLEEVQAEIERTQPALVILDPLYLAAAGAKGSDLYAMGDALLPLQEICQAGNAALVITTHWNKRGEGSGAQRFTGVGPGAWGRVLGSAAVERKTTDAAGGTAVLLRWEFTGSEIPEKTFRARRIVGADDPADLGSPLTYSVNVTEEAAEATELSRNQQRIHDALASDTLLVREIGDRLASDGQGPPLKERTIQRILGELGALGIVESDDPGPGLAARWKRR